MAGKMVSGAGVITSGAIFNAISAANFGVMSEGCVPDRSSITIRVSITRAMTEEMAQPSLLPHMEAPIKLRMTKFEFTNQ